MVITSNVFVVVNHRSWRLLYVNAGRQRRRRT